MSDPAPAEKPQPKRQSIAASTAAMTVYNVLAVARTRCVAKHVATKAKQLGQTLGVEQVNQAFKDLKNRKLISLTKTGAELLDAKHRIVVGRDRSDEHEPDGGWNGWVVHDTIGERPKLRRLGEVLA